MRISTVVLYIVLHVPGQLMKPALSGTGIFKTPDSVIEATQMTDITLALWSSDLHWMASRESTAMADHERSGSASSEYLIMHKILSALNVSLLTVLGTVWQDLVVVSLVSIAALR